MKFQNPSIHGSKVNRRTQPPPPPPPPTHTDKPKAICPSNFFKVGGIKSGVGYVSFGYLLMTVFCTGTSNHLYCQILQADPNSLAKWEMDWQMKLNVSKCHSMRVTRLHPSKQIQFNYTLHHQTLEQVQTAKYIQS